MVAGPIAAVDSTIGGNKNDWFVAKRKRCGFESTQYFGRLVLYTENCIRSKRREGKEYARRIDLCSYRRRARTSCRSSAEFRSGISLPADAESKFSNLMDESVSRCQFSGKVVLIVNTASECGYTRQHGAYTPQDERGFHRGK